MAALRDLPVGPSADCTSCDSAGLQGVRGHLTGAVRELTGDPADSPDGRSPCGRSGSDGARWLVSGIVHVRSLWYVRLRDSRARNKLSELV